MDKRLIEDSLPIKEINEQSVHDTNIRQGHIKNIHTWWARRPLPACRAAIFASLIPAPKNENEREEKHHFISLLVNNEIFQSNNEYKWIIQEAKSNILKANKGISPKILDPFAGGGSIPFEAQRLGCETYVSDLNPVANIIELCTLLYPQMYNRLTTEINYGTKQSRKSKFISDIKYWSNWIYENLQSETKCFYLPKNSGEEPVAYIWARTLICPNPACKAEVPLVSQWWLINKKINKVAIKPIPKPDKKKIDFVIKNNIEIDFKPESGTISGAKGLCLCCNQPIKNEYIRRYGKIYGLGHRLLAIVLINKKTKKREYRLPSNEEETILGSIPNVIDNSNFKDMIPKELIFDKDKRNFWITEYGPIRFMDLFNKRQLYVILNLVKHIRKAPKELSVGGNDSNYTKAIMTILSCMFSNFIRKFNCITVWNGTIQNAFGRQTLPMMWSYPEGNPLSNSAGSWKASSKVMIQALSKIQFGNPATKITRESVIGLTYEDKTFDAIITDPPYYDSIAYSDLSDFFYVWMKRIIGDLYPNVFNTQLSPKRSEIVQNPAHKKTKKFFEDKLKQAFAVLRRVLKDDGIIVMVYAHKSTDAWETLIKVLLEEDIIVTSSWPLHTERPRRLRAQGSAALASSVFIVCRKRQAVQDGFADDVEKELKDTLYERLAYFWSQGIRGSDFFMSAIGPAVQVFGKYKKVYTLEGKELTVADLLLKVRGIVSDFALERIVKGRGGHSIDDESRFYLLWRWAFGNAVMPAGEVIPMAQSLGVEFNKLVSKSGVLQKKSGKVTLKSPFDRKEEKNLGEPSSGEIAPLIDVLHRAVHLWQAGDRQELSNLIARSVPGGSRDSLEQLAQSIIDVLPDDDKEATLYVNFLTGARQLPKAEGKIVVEYPEMDLQFGEGK